MITPLRSFVVVRHVTAQSGSYSDLTVLAAAAAAAMEFATIITTLTLLCGTNQQTFFAHSKSSKRMLKKLKKKEHKNMFILGIHCVDFVSIEHEVFKEVKIFFLHFFGIIRHCSPVFWYLRFEETYLLLYCRYILCRRQ